MTREYKKCFVVKTADINNMYYKYEQTLCKLDTAHLTGYICSKCHFTTQDVQIF